MKASAAYLCDSVLCSLASHYEVKTVVVKDKQVVLFEHETFIFEKKTSWQITFHDQTFDCSFDCALQIQLTDFSELEIRLYRLHSSLLKPSVIPLKQQLIFGSGTQCDVQLADCFSDQVVELSFFADTLHYHVFQDAVCAVNGKPAASIGELHTPALLQIEHFSLFLLQDGVAYNGGFVSRRVELPCDIPEIQRRYEVHSKYIPVCPIEDFSIREPEFCTLPQHRTASLLSMGPMLTMSCASLLSAWMSFQHSQNSSALIMPVMMLISAVFWPLCSAWKENRKQKRLKQERRKMYLEECEQIKKQIQEEKKRIHMNLVCPEALKREDFWQVRPNHPQFLKLPLGKGKLSLPYSIIAHQQHPDSSESDCHQALKKLHEESRMLDDALVSCDLQIHRCISFISNKKAIRETAEKIIIAMGSLMCLKEVHYVLFSNDEQLQWDLRKTSLFQFQHQKLIFDESVDSADAQKALKQLDLTRTICFVQEQTLFNRISNDIRNQVKTVYFLSHDDIVPPVCSTVYHVSSDGVIEEGLIKLPFHQGVKKRKEELMKLKFQCQKRTAHRDFLSYYSELSVERLLWMWESEAEPCALLGSNDFGEPIYFSLSEHEEGPHGLIAGTTGSGKSVLLLNLLLSLSVQCSPEQLQMVILDYKGGSLVQQLHSRGHILPHLVGGLSNQSSMIGRALSSIRYECLRRQRCFTQASLLSGKTVSSLEDYRLLQRNYPELPQLASLLIVVDEFAELKREEPDFLKTLISLSRIGRSLGFHLILCTQKITGVVDDEITGNSRFHIALKTSRPSESRELIGYDDAAYLKEPGEFIFECDHHLIKGKAPYCLAPYHSYHQHDTMLTDSCGNAQKLLKTSDFPDMRQSEVLIELMAEAAQEMKWKPTSLWLEPLSPFDASKWLKKQMFFLGLADFPETRSQKPLYLKHHQHLFLGYENENQKEALLKYALKQLLHLGGNLYFIQLVSAICPRHLSIGSDSDQMERLLGKMTTVQDEHTVLLIDDLSEFSEYFSSVSSLTAFLFKAVQRKTQVIALVRKPFNVSQTVLDQFETKLLFADVNDTETLQLFHFRRENCRIALKSQAYTIVNEKLCVLQLGYLSSQLKENIQPLQVPYLPERIKKPDDTGTCLGISVNSLTQIQIQQGEALIVTGNSKVHIQKYCQLMNLEAKMMDVIELSETMTRKSIRKETVLWIGPYFQYQTLMTVDPKAKLPLSYQEGMIVKDGTMELIRLFDE